MPKVQPVTLMSPSFENSDENTTLTSNLNGGNTVTRSNYNSSQSSFTRPLTQKFNNEHGVCASESNAAENEGGVTISDIDRGRDSLNHTNKFGYILVILAAISFSFVAISVHVATTWYSFPTISVIFYRSLAQFVLSLSCKVCLPSGNLSLSRHQMLWLIAQGILGSLSSISLFYSLALMRAGDALALFFIAPVFAFLIAHITLSEPFTLYDIFSLVLSMSGVILMAKSEHTNLDNNDNIDFKLNHLNHSAASSNVSLGIASALLSALFFASATTIVRFFGESVSAIDYVFAFGAITICLSAPIGGPRSLSFLTANATGTILSIIAGISGFLAQCFFNKGLQYIRAGQAILLANIEVPLTYFIGLVLLHEIPVWSSTLGATLIVLSGVLLGLGQR